MTRISALLLVLAATFLVATAAVASAAAPANDNFAAAAPLVGASGTTSGTNVEATGEAGEPANHEDAFCGDFPGDFTQDGDPACADLGDASVWYSWTAPSTGLFAFDTFGTTSGIDSVLGVYTGSAVNALTEVNSNQGFNDDYAAACCLSRVVFSAVSGTTYKIAVSGCCGVPDSGEGSFTLNWGSATRPVNDNFASPTALNGGTGTSPSQTNADSSYETGEPTNRNTTLSDFGGTAIWYTWTAPSSGYIVFSVGSGAHMWSGGGYTPNLGVYTGNLGSLTEVAYSTTGSVGFAASMNTTYVIGAGGLGSNDYYNYAYMGGMGTFTLGWAPDGTAPETFITSSSGGKYSVTVGFSGSDNVTTASNLDFECQLDGGAFQPCNAPSVTYNTTGGRHTVQVRAIDEANNVDGSPASATVRAKGSPKRTG